MKNQQLFNSSYLPIYLNESSKHFPSVLKYAHLFIQTFLLIVLFGVTQNAVGFEAADARKYVKLCRELGRDQGITDRRELREYMRECVGDVRDIHTDRKNRAKKGEIFENEEIDIVQMNGGSIKFR